MSIPKQVRAGDTLKFTESIAEYPASAWTLTYNLINADGPQTIVATANADTYEVSVPYTVTALWKDGTYKYVSHVFNGTERYQVAEGSFTVLPDISTLSSLDIRSHAKKMIDAIDAVLEKNASLDQQSYQIAGRAITRYSLLELRKFRSEYVAELNREEAKANIQESRKKRTMRWVFR